MTPPPDAVARFTRDMERLLDPPQHGEGDHAQHGGGGLPSSAPPVGSPLHQPLAGPPPRAGEELALAVSGGPDSLALLLLAQAALPGQVIAATVDHGLRPEAADEAAFVSQVCATLAVPHAALRITVPDDPAGLQAAARAGRYRALADWAVASGAIALATAHHADDQAETVLMRVLRGAGVAGLRGIQERRPLADGIALLRPLLAWRKRELVGLVAAAGLVAIDDPSNRDPRYDRTHARTLMQDAHFDPARLAAVARNMRDAEAALAFSADALFAERWQADTLAVADLPREYRRRLLVKALESLAPAAILRGDEVDRLLDRLAAGQVSTLAGQRIEPGPIWRFTAAPPHRSV